MEGLVNAILYFSYLLIGVAIIAVIVLPLIKAIDDPQTLVKMGVGVLALGVLFLIAWGISGSEVTETYAKYNVGPDLSKIVGGTLTLTYLLLVVSIVGIVYTELVKLFK